MKVGIIGSGGREHALCHEIKKSNEVKEIYCFPGNGGTHSLAKNINLDINNFELLKEFIIKENINIKLMDRIKGNEILNMKNKSFFKLLYLTKNRQPRRRIAGIIKPAVFSNCLNERFIWDI